MTVGDLGVPVNRYFSLTTIKYSEKRSATTTRITKNAPQCSPLKSILKRDMLEEVKCVTVAISAWLVHDIRMAARTSRS